MKRLPSLIALVRIASACGGSGGDSATVTAPPPVMPTSVVIASASVAYNNFTNGQDVSLHLHNNGGNGQYYLEFWALPTSPNGQRRMLQSDAVTVVTGYDEAVVYSVGACTLGVNCGGGFAVEAVKVKSRPVNTAVYTQTDCKVVGTQPDFCP